MAQDNDNVRISGEVAISLGRAVNYIMTETKEVYRSFTFIIDHEQEAVIVTKEVYRVDF